MFVELELASKNCTTEVGFHFFFFFLFSSEYTSFQVAVLRIIHQTLIMIEVQKMETMRGSILQNQAKLDRKPNGKN